uniref:Uncharacterized protein n=1 Tax=Rhizophora mucronata TaxID=61149 RepID=A0A2P2M532_RHIMU
MMNQRLQGASTPTRAADRLTGVLQNVLLSAAKLWLLIPELCHAADFWHRTGGIILE